MVAKPCWIYKPPPISLVYMNNDSIGFHNIRAIAKCTKDITEYEGCLKRCWSRFLNSFLYVRYQLRDLKRLKFIPSIWFHRAISALIKCFCLEHSTHKKTGSVLGKLKAASILLERLGKIVPLFRIINMKILYFRKTKKARQTEHSHRDNLPKNVNFCSLIR